MYLTHTLTVFIGMKFDWCYRFVWKELDNHLWTHTDTHTQWIKLSSNRLSNKNVCVYEILNEHTYTHTHVHSGKETETKRKTINELNQIKWNIYDSIVRVNRVFFCYSWGWVFFKKKCNESISSTQTAIIIIIIKWVIHWWINRIKALKFNSNFFVALLN